jgi:S-(hydroxymethyl)glutathione dehydrogenase / alcohol dehydrogenase
MRLFKAAVLFESGSPLELVDLEMPFPSEGQVLVRIAYAGICKSQLMEIDGLRGVDKYLPHLLGHEAAGVVEEIGSGVSKVKPGDHVVVSWIRGSGLNVGGPKFLDGSIQINAGQVTTFSELSMVSENCVFPIPRDFPLKIAALFGCAIPTGAGMALKELPGDLSNSNVAVFGLGGIGLSALYAVTSRKPKSITAIDFDLRKLEAVKVLGVNHSINAAHKDFLHSISSITNQIGFDYAIDATGTTAGILQAFESVKKFGGLCIFASHPDFGQKLAIDPFDLISGKNIRGSWGGGINLDENLSDLLDLFGNNEVVMNLLSSDVFEFEEINLAISNFRGGNSIRPILKMGAGK